VNLRFALRVPAGTYFQSNSQEDVLSLKTAEAKKKKKQAPWACLPRKASGKSYRARFIAGKTLQQKLHSPRRLGPDPKICI